MVSIVPLQRRTEASPARSIFSLERRRREEGEGRGGMDLSGTQGELPIPMHAAASSYRNSGEGSAGGHVLQVHHEHGNNNNGHESPAQIEAANSGKKRATVGAASSGSGGSAVKYRECLKNHAAAMGGNATDGCGEFMPSGEEGSLDALMCSACGCHRNFHRKEVDDMDAEGCAGHGYGHRAGRRLIAPAMPHHKNGGGGGGLLVAADPYCAYAAMRAVAPSPPLHHQQFLNAMPLSAMHTSESDEMDGSGGHGMSAAARGSGSSSSKKRFRTKFTPEQKARMLDFAEHVGWRLQKLDDGMVQAFCQEIGVKRRVLKVWMHNNKHNLATKRLEAPLEAAVASPPQPHVPMSMMPPPQQPSSQAGPSFNRGGPSSPPPQMPMPMVPPPPFHRGPGSPSPLKLD